MAVLRFAEPGGYRALDIEQCREAGKVLADEYRANAPFPHVVTHLAGAGLHEIKADWLPPILHRSKA